MISILFISIPASALIRIGNASKTTTTELLFQFFSNYYSVVRTHTQRMKYKYMKRVPNVRLNYGNLRIRRCHQNQYVIYGLSLSLYHNAIVNFYFDVESGEIVLC